MLKLALLIRDSIFGLRFLILINPLNLPAVAGWCQLCYAGRCVSKTSPRVGVLRKSRLCGASLETQGSQRKNMFSFLLIKDSRYAEEGRKEKTIMRSRGVTVLNVDL